MILDPELDLATLDRQVARAHGAIEGWFASLGSEAGREAARRSDPFEGCREVSGQTALDALRKLDPGPIHAAHRDALSRWIYELLQARVGRSLVIDEADAVHSLDPSLRDRAPREVGAERLERGEAATFDEAFQALLTAPHPTAAETALRRLDELAPPVAAVRNELRARRVEVARRLGLPDPWALSCSDSSKLEVLARRVLDATEPLALEVHKGVRRRTGGASPAHAVFDAFARDAREGWPARLGVRWLEDVFRVVAPRPPRGVRVPRALGGASFLRAAYAWGHALRLGGTARSLPFALARDPYPIEAHAVGGALAVTVADRVFAKRKLGLSSRAADVHARVLARVLFVTLRRMAADVVNATRASIGEDTIEESSGRVFGHPLPAALGACWSYGGIAATSRGAEVPRGLAARLVGALRAHDLVRVLVERFDEDWFDNPRAGAHLASVSAGPVWQGEPPVPECAVAVARAFEERLG